MRFTELAIDDLLDAWPGLRRAPVYTTDESVIAGTLAFSLEPPGLPRIEDDYLVRIDVPLGRDAFPIVRETAGRIRRVVDEHVNPDGSFCLGSPLALAVKLGRSPTLIDFVDQCVVPFLYAASWRQHGRSGWPFDELPHYGPGMLEDYQRLLGVNGAHRVGQALTALRHRPRVANKMECPCGCARRLGKCGYRMRLANLRASVTRTFFRSLHYDYCSRISSHTI